MALRSMAWMVWFLLGLGSSAQAGMVAFENSQLVVDGTPQPQLFGAELQYFRLRGGQQRNIPRATVIALWNKALDRMVEAKMNAISFYIPWDFHEYAEGKFDFHGDVDEDGDGNPDYPSRDLFTFLRLVEEHGIHHILVRPGPYVNAEWGFLGFGAIPEWFHQKFPDSHMRGPNGNRTRLYDYHSPELLEYTRRWFRALHSEVLSKYIGPGKPVDFLQIDNETNFMWQSIYAHDYSASALARYRDFLRAKYGSLEALNAAEGTTFADWSKVDAPRQPKINIAEDRDWYAFQDESIHSYLKKIRGFWEELGVKEPSVLFTLAESYNATDNGLLPNYRYRNDPGATGMMTVNLYPKTFERRDQPLLNDPFKADHDVKNADAANDFYLGKRVEWAMGPEIQGGWWRGINVTPEARRQTYLTTLGHGLKALFVYYFNEGDNFDPHWQKEAIRPFFDALRNSAAYRGIPEEKLPGEFWNQLQSTIEHDLLSGISAYGIWHQDAQQAENLFFDAPLDGNAEPRKHFYDLKEIGEKIAAPYGAFLGRATEVEDRVCIVRDTLQHLPSPDANLNSIAMSSTWSAGLLGYILQTGVNPHIFHWGLNPASELGNCDLLFWQDNGVTDPALVKALEARMASGAVVVGFLEDSLARGLGFDLSSQSSLLASSRFGAHSFQAVGVPSFTYRVGLDPRCQPLLFNALAAPAGYDCAVRGGGHFLQVGTAPYQAYNTSDYGYLSDSPTRVALLRHFYALAKTKSVLELPADADRTVAFARTVDGSSYWITAKTGSPLGSNSPLKVHGLGAKDSFRVLNVLAGTESSFTGAELESRGFPLALGPSGSAAFWLERSRP